MRRLFLNRKFILLVVVVVLAAGVALTGYLYRLDLEIQRSALRDVTARQAASIRASLEQEINTTLNLTQGLVVYVATNPDLTQKQFVGIASRILQRTPYIRNIGLARDNVITHIYPLEGNEAALGFRYAESREQWPAVSRAIATGNSVIAGPVNLVQGGSGLISRIPIYTDDAGRDYWGIASLVIDIDAFFEQVGLPAYEEQGDIEVALRGKDGTGVAGPVFHGNADLFASVDTLKATISLPEGSWMLAVHPRGGWQRDSVRSEVILSVGLIVSVLVSGLIFALLDTLVALSHAKRRAEQANEVKTRFFSHMAHELRTPLTAIQGALGLLTSETVRQDPERSGELLDNAVRNCARLNWIVNDVLDLKRLEAGGITYAFEACPVADLMGDAVDGVEQYAQQYRTRIEVENRLESDAAVFGDAHRLQQVLVNLLSNAIKYSPDDSTVVINAASIEDGVRIEVIDQGEGVSEDKVEDIFNEFSQDKLSPRRNIASTGLGLSISKLIIEQHHGRIGVYNIAGGGSSFYIELPRYRA